MSRKQSLQRTRKSWLRKRNRIMVTIETPIGEITIPVSFGRAEAARQCCALLLEARNVAGLSLIINGKWSGARDGPAS